MDERRLAEVLGQACYSFGISLTKTMAIADSVAIELDCKLSTNTWHDIARKAYKKAKADKLERWKQGKYNERS